MRSLLAMAAIWLRRVLILVGGEAAIALICRYLNPWLIDRLATDPVLYTRTLGPFVEETMKGSIVALGLYRKRVGLLVAAAIWGFAVGAGFEVPADPEVGARLCELAHLEKSIGRTGLIALHPVSPA